MLARLTRFERHQPFPRGMVKERRCLENSAGGRHCSNLDSNPHRMRRLPTLCRTAQPFHGREICVRRIRESLARATR